MTASNPRDELLLRLRSTDPHEYPLVAAEAMLKAADEIERLESRLASVIAELAHYTAYPGKPADETTAVKKGNGRREQFTDVDRPGLGPADKTSSPPVDNDHVAEGCEKFDGPK